MAKTTDPATLKLLRLRSASRHIIALQRANYLIDGQPYWNVDQALTSAGLPKERWKDVVTEEFVQLFPEGLPSANSIFTRRTRRRVLEGVVLWSASGILPTMFRTVTEAINARDILKVEVLARSEARKLGFDETA